MPRPGVAVKCVAAGCSNVRNTRKCANADPSQWTVFHSFPKDPKSCLNWVRACGNEKLANNSISSLTRLGVCEDHFTSHDLEHMKSKLTRNATLKAIIFPSIFSHKEPLGRDVLVRFLAKNNLNESLLNEIPQIQTLNCCQMPDSVSLPVTSPSALPEVPQLVGPSAGYSEVLSIGEKVKPLLKRNVVPSQNIPGGSQADVRQQPENEISRMSMAIPKECELASKPEMIIKRKVVEDAELQENIEQANRKTCPSKQSAFKRPKITLDPLQLKGQDFQCPSTTDKNDHPNAFTITDLDNKYPCTSTAPDKNTGTNLVKLLTKDKSAGINILPIHMMVKNPEVLCFYTGLHSFKLLSSIEKCVLDIEVKSPTNTKLLCLKDRVLLVLISIKMNLDFGAIAPMFNISRPTCKRYFEMLVPLLATVFESAIASPTREDIRIKIPIAFKNYTSTSVVTDCARIPVERSQCSKCKILTYSHNKKHHSVKFELGISPSGMITSVTQCYQGKPSNKFITSESHGLQKLDLQNGDFRERGFFIENECLQRNVILHQPSFSIKKKPVSSAEEIRKAKNAKTRMHAERVIEKIREFEMLNSTITWHLLPYIENCLVVACGIVNLGNPAISSSSFM